MRQGSNLGDVMVQKSKMSFSQQLKKVAVEMVTENRDQDHMALIQNNAVALGLKSRSSEWRAGERACRRRSKAGLH